MGDEGRIDNKLVLVPMHALKTIDRALRNPPTKADHFGTSVSVLGAIALVVKTLCQPMDHGGAADISTIILSVLLGAAQIGRYSMALRSKQPFHVLAQEFLTEFLGQHPVSDEKPRHEFQTRTVPEKGYPPPFRIDFSKEGARHPPPYLCGRCGRERCEPGWCAECVAEEARLVGIAKLGEDSWAIFTGPPGEEEGPIVQAAWCTSFEAALAAGRLLRGRPWAFEVRLARADAGWKGFVLANARSEAP